MTAWRKSTRCGASNTCIEVAWRTACSNDACVQVGHHPAAVLVRDSSDPDGPTLALTREAFGRLLTTIKETR